MKTLLLEVTTTEEDPLVLEDKLEIGTVDFTFTPLDVDKAIGYPGERTKRKAVYIDTGYGKDYIVTYKNKRRLISELYPVYGIYVFRGETDKSMKHIIKELEEERSLTDVFQN